MRFPLVRGSTLSPKWAAEVPGLTEYGKTCMLEKRISRQSPYVSWNSSSLSPGNPVSTSVVMDAPGDSGADKLDRLSEALRRIPPSHAPQHAVAPTLEWEVKVRAQSRVLHNPAVPPLPPEAEVRTPRIRGIVVLRRMFSTRRSRSAPGISKPYEPSCVPVSTTSRNPSSSSARICAIRSSGGCSSPCP